MATDYVKLAEEIKKKGYKRNLSSREIQGHKAKSSAIKNKKEKKPDLEAKSKKAGFYVHGHKNFGDVYEE